MRKIIYSRISLILVLVFSLCSLLGNARSACTVSEVGKLDACKSIYTAGLFDYTGTDGLENTSRCSDPTLGRDNWIQFNVPAKPAGVTSSIAEVFFVATWTDSDKKGLVIELFNGPSCDKLANTEQSCSPIASSGDTIEINVEWGRTYWLHVVNIVSASGNMGGYTLTADMTKTTAGVFNKHPAVPRIVGSFYAPCGGNTTLSVANAETGVSYDWTKTYPQTSYIGSDTTMTLALNPNDNFFYTITATNGTCTTDTIINVTTCLTGIDDELKNSKQFLVSPNPFTSEITISLDNYQAGRVEIYNTNGTLVYLTNISAQTNTINLDTLEKGLYYLVLTYTDGTRVSNKILKN